MLPTKSYFQQQVEIFHEKFGLVVNEKPTIPCEKELRLRTNLIIEEALEFAMAAGYQVILDENGKLDYMMNIYQPDLVEMADAIADINYVVAGAAATLGIQDMPVFTEVHRSNMSKVWEDGTVKRREDDGKIMKPPTYSPANIAGELEKQSGR